MLLIRKLLHKKIYLLIIYIRTITIVTMRKIIPTIIYLIFTTSLFAQMNSVEYNTPDYIGIKDLISDQYTESYYPKLMERMKQCDTTLTIEEYKFLYYGYIFQPEFSIFHMPSSQESELEKYYKRISIRKKSYDNIITLINQILENDPFYIRGINYLGYVLHLKGEEEESVKRSLQLVNLVNVILSSGNGESPETGYHVINVEHEYVIMNYLQAAYGMQFFYGSRVTTHLENNSICDCFTINRNPTNQICFYVPYEIMLGQVNIVLPEL